MASSRHLNLPEQNHFGRRRHGHVPQISISDGTHHVTEAIGDLYGDDDTSKRDSTASSYAPSPPLDDNRDRRPYFDSPTPYTSNDTSPLGPHSTERYPTQSNGSPVEGRRRKSSLHSSHSHSPPLLTRTNSSESANQHFPLNDIDSQSSPAAVAQELSNLQAIRRMSMNVDVADPDLPAFGPTFSVPTTPPSSTDDEDDAARMFWVPARIHPELAPSEFKTFVEDRVERIRRRSNEGNELSMDGVGRTGSSSSINRRKSMLSRTIDSGIGYQDGADVLERKRSKSSHNELDFPDSLQELEPKLKDPVELVRKMSVDSSRKSLDTEDGLDEDAPILPSAPGGQSLRRSTRTNYRRGSLRKGERVTGSLRRGLQRTSDGDAEQIAPTAIASTPPAPRQAPDEDQNYDLARIKTAPDPPPAGQPDNFSRPSRRGGRPQLQPSASLGDVRGIESYDQRPEAGPPESRNPLSFRSRIASNGRTTAHLPTQSAPQAVPQITETPPAPQSDHRHSAPPQPNHPVVSLPERKSSHDYARQSHTQHIPAERSQLRPDFSNSRRPNQTINDMANSPSMMPGMSTRTDALTFIPSFTDDREERKPEKKSKSNKDHDGVSKKPSWGWLLGQDSEKEKDRKEREKEEKELRKSKKSKPVIEKPHDNTRLDLLSAASDGPRGRESLVLDRDSIRLDEDRRKDGSVRKPAPSDTKSSGASGIFSSLFGGKKKTSERDARKADINRRLSPDPPRRNLRADIDYNWTRFSILEERAIYRMAHLKLANPRRALYSQVLLSNFMYSYLAKVQQMHPQIQIPAFVQKQQNGNGQKGELSKEQSSQSDEYDSWQRYQEQHDGGSSPPSNTDTSGSSSNFIEDYDPGHQEQEDNRRQQEQHQQQYRGKNQQYVNGSGNGNGNGNAGPYPQQPLAYAQKSPRQKQQQNQRDLYTAQGLFDRDKTPEDDDDLW